MERRQIVQLAQRAAPNILVTLVRALGSSYRHPGARLLTTSGASHVGTISGGCLEAEVVRKAAWLTRSGAHIERYSTLIDDIADVPYGLGCGGTIDLLFEPAGSPEAVALLQAMRDSLDGASSIVVSWLPEPGRPLQRMIATPEGKTIFASLDLAQTQRDSLPRCISSAFEAPGETARTLTEADCDVFVETLYPPQRLFVLGAGDDAQPIVAMAAMLGWTVIVADGRAQLARTERFSAAASVLQLVDANALGVQATDAVVLMTHSYEQDRDILVALLPIAPQYLGLLGARHRSSLLIRDAALLTGLSVEQCCDRLYTPVGLDLGGDGAEAIALSVVAEAHARCQGKLGASRRLTAEAVAEQVDRQGTNSYPSATCLLSS